MKPRPLLSRAAGFETAAPRRAALTQTALKQTVLALALLLTTTGCSTVSGWFSEENETRLEGERISVLNFEKDLAPDADDLFKQPFAPPEAWENEFWPQAGGYPSHAMQHVALNPGRLSRIWTASIGSGSSRRFPLTSAPIVVESQIFTLDAKHHVSAFDTKTGDRLWRQDIRDTKEKDLVIGGGISYSRGTLYATNGYDELLALNPATGDILWRESLPAPARAAPTIIDDRIFVMTLDNRLLALDVATHKIVWDYAGFSETAGLVGAPSPAVDREIVVPAFSSGEIFALRVENGSVAWSDNLSSMRQSGGLASISDIRGLPVIDKGLVIAVSFGGRMVAIDARSGQRVWTREIGGAESPWLAGNVLFVISSKNELIALDRENGAIRWVMQLPRYKNESAHDGPIFWTGPVLAGGRLIVVSSNGQLREISPEDGSTLREADIGYQLRIAPIVAGKTLYLLAEDGTLAAYQ